MSVFSKVTLSLNDFMNKILIGNHRGAVDSTERRVLHPLSLCHPRADLGESPFENLYTVCVCVFVRVSVCLPQVAGVAAGRFRAVLKLLNPQRLQLFAGCCEQILATIRQSEAQTHIQREEDDLIFGT